MNLYSIFDQLTALSTMPPKASASSDHVSLAAVEELLNRQERRFKELLEMQADAYEGMVTQLTESTNRRIDSFIENSTRQLNDLKHSLEYTQAQFKDTSVTVMAHGRSILDASETLNDLESQREETVNKMDYLENQSRRNNIRIEGIPDVPGETWEKTEATVRELFSSKLELDGPAIAIERAHKVGNRHPAQGRNGEQSKRDRAICVKLISYKDKTAILKNAKKLKSTGIYINEDYSDRVLAKRREQLPQLREARDSGKIAYFNYDKLVVKNMPTSR